MNTEDAMTTTTTEIVPETTITGCFNVIRVGCINEWVLDVNYMYVHTHAHKFHQGSSRSVLLMYTHMHTLTHTYTHTHTHKSMGGKYQTTPPPTVNYTSTVSI